MNTTSYKKILKSEQGFTLVEVIAVLIILGILAAVAVPKYINLEEDAKRRAIDAAISEINGRESMIWAQVKISSNAGSLDETNIDQKVFDAMMAPGDSTATPPIPKGPGYDLNLSTDASDKNYTWSAPPTAGSYDNITLKFQGSNAYPVSRKKATMETPAIWKRLSTTTTTTP